MRNHTRALAATLLLAILFWSAACNNAPQSNSNQAVTPPPKSAKWVAIYRSPSTKGVTGTILGLYAFTSISVVSDEVAYVAGSLPDATLNGTTWGVVVRTTDGGKTWQERLLNQPQVKDGALNAIHFVNPTTGWIVGVDRNGGGLVLKTTDSGESWAISTLAFKQKPTSVFFTDDNTGFIGGVSPLPVDPTAQKASARAKRQKAAPANGEEEGEETEGGPTDLLGTTDGGKTWQSQRRLQTSINDIYFVDRMTGWAAGFKGAIYQTTDGGRVWSPQTTELEPSEGMIDFTGDRSMGFALLGIHFFDKDHGFAAAMATASPEGRALGTVNGGEIWARKWIVRDSGVQDVVMVAPQEVMAIVRAGHYAYRSIDGGGSWLVEPIEFEQDVVLYRLGAANPHKVWAVGGAGAIFLRVSE